MGATPEPILSGVIEGFYGPPWSRAERLALFAQLAALGLNTYLYAPKDDLHHRASWRSNYGADQLDALAELISVCKEKRLRFIYALSPGLDIRYRGATDRETLRARFAQLLARGCEHFALLFDDIPDRMQADDATRFDSFSAAQAQVANELFRWVRERSPAARFLFCPTPYCGRMAERHYGGAGYLETLGRELLPEIEIFWTGPEIISREITVAHVRELQANLRRKPLIWDNLFANDYDGRRFFCGPYAGRPLELRGEVAGLLLNPNNEFPLNFVPFRTFSQFLTASGDWDARVAFRSALREWLPHFATIGEPLAGEDLESFADCFYLPHEDGADAEKLFAQLQALLAAPPSGWGEPAVGFRDGAARLRTFCARLTELKDRALFAALHRRAWELREELDLLEKYVEFKARPGNADAPFTSDFHLPLTYRGGLVARLQRQLEQDSDGTFSPAVPTPNPSEP